MLVPILFATSGAGIAAADFGQFHSAERYTLPAGTIHDGDLYVGAGDVRIAGDVDGDLLASSAVVSVGGNVAGDLFIAGGRAEIRGTVGDSARLFTGEARVSGTIDGDLIVFGGQITIEPEARITGNLVICGGRVQLDGVVEGGMKFIGGEVTIRGSVLGDADFEADRIQLLAGSEIGGDLDYSSRKELEQDPDAGVLGEIRFEPKVDDDENGGFFDGWALRFWLLLAAMVCGLALLALLRGPTPLVLERIDREGLLAGVVGFVTFLVFPTAAVLALLPLITIPFVLIAATLYGSVLYLAKLPVALWIGTRLLKLLGRAEPSRYLGLILGLVVLYLLFSVPYLGRIVWLVSAWLGMGSGILALRHARIARQS
jgi:cytoskeletal protein CcmA (bactofilin family)